MHVIMMQMVTDIFYIMKIFRTSDLDPQSVPDDNDIDSVPTVFDEDDDNDGYIDEYEIFQILTPLIKIKDL